MRLDSYFSLFQQSDVISRKPFFVRKNSESKELSHPSGILFLFVKIDF